MLLRLTHLAATNALPLLRLPPMSDRGLGVGSRGKHRPSGHSDAASREAREHSTLQAALLPDSLPDLPGLDVAARYLPSVRGMDIGGDFYDLVRVDDTTAAAVIGDVQGHNVTAAALMGRVHPAIRSHAASAATPSQALAQRSFRSDPACCSASTPTCAIPPTEVTLTPGTVLALYTDGLVETPGVDMDDAMSGLATQLARASTQPMDRLATTLIDHARQTAPRTDDIALLLIGLATAG